MTKNFIEYISSEAIRAIKQDTYRKKWNKFADWFHKKSLFDFEWECK